MTSSQAKPQTLVGTQVAGRDQAGSLVFDAKCVAPLLGLKPEVFMEELKRGMVYQVHELGMEEDSGRTRVTFRYRARQSVLIVDALGFALHVG
ncbi:DUF6522 family protein [Azospirillum sp. Sh1]|uniref:DUF6522 family protein n=1 Tax=Azospirillum sp. Sh1 TaxID=2607285 RepID=UPI0011F065C9|nr:DUF6522 family protein [Azospirillum sp. Sh1]KAA0572902.1 hypothetical protein FZ029_22360 [Azospirillum sp. Sh1]